MRMSDGKRDCSQQDCQERVEESKNQRRRGNYKDPLNRAGELYPANNVAFRGLPSGLGAPLICNLPGYADAGNRGFPPVYPYVLPVVSGCQSASRSKELTLRVLCPSDKIGRVLGKGGSIINSVRQASGAHIKVDDFKAGVDERVIAITSKESPDDFKCKSIEAVLLLQEKINDKGDETVTIRLLVPDKVIGVIIGKGGSIVNDIRNRTKARIRISKEAKPDCASDSDKLVEVTGNVASVREALVQIILRLRDDVLMEKKNVHNSLSVPVPLYPCSASFVTRDDDNASLSPNTLNPFGGLPPPLTIEMLIPGHAVGKVLGEGGANLANIRKISGAVVDIFDKSSSGDLIAFISGTSEQMRSAEDLIQAFIMAT